MTELDLKKKKKKERTKSSMLEYDLWRQQHPVFICREQILPREFVNIILCAQR